MKNMRVLTGDDHFRLQERVRFFRSAFAAKFPDGEIQIFDINSSWGKVTQACFSSGGLFGGASLVILHDFFTPDTFEKAKKSGFFESVSNQDSLTVIVAQGKLPKNTKFGKFFHAQEKEIFAEMKPHELKKWAKTLSEKIKLQISDKGIMDLSRMTGGSTARMHSEMTKLKTFAGENPLDETQLKDLVLSTPKADIWDFTDAFRTGNAAAALSSYSRIRGSGTSGYEVLPMLYREAILLSQIHASEEAKASASNFSLSPFVTSKSKPIAQKVSKDDLKWLIDSLFQIEIGMKTGEIKTSTTDETELDAHVEQIIITWAKVLKSK